MSDSDSGDVKVRNGFEILRARLEEEYRNNIQQAGAMGGLSTLSALQEFYPAQIAQVTEAEAAVADYYNGVGRKLGGLIITACADEGLSDDELIALVKDVTFQLSSGPRITDIVDDAFVQQSDDESYLVDPEEGATLARNGLSYRVAEYLGIM